MNRTKFNSATLQGPLQALVLMKDGTERMVRLNRRKAIRLRCLDCSGFEPSEVSRCEHTMCQLYPYRMGTGSQSPTDRRKAIAAYCLENCMLDQVGEVTKCPSLSCSLHSYRVSSRVDRSVVSPKNCI